MLISNALSQTHITKIKISKYDYFPNIRKEEYTISFFSQLFDTFKKRNTIDRFFKVSY